MNTRERIGQVIVILVACVGLSASALIICLYLLKNGATLETVPPRLIRFGLTAALFVCVYRGSRAIRIIAIVLFFSAGLIAFTIPWVTCTYLGMAILLGLPYVGHFQQYQTAKRASPRRPEGAQPCSEAHR